MPIELIVQNHHKMTYVQNSMMVAQQLRNPLRQAVTVIEGKGESMSIAELFGTKAYLRGTDRSRTNPEQISGRERRVLFRPNVIEDGEYIDTVDKFDTLMDPSSILMRNSIAAVERGVFDTILGIEPGPGGTFSVTGGGIMGRMATGKTGQTVTGLPNGNIIPASTTGLTLDKLRAVRKALRRAEFGTEDADQLYCCLTPAQEDDLLGIAAQTGLNLNGFNVDQLRDGKPTPLMGINWIMTNRLPMNASGQRQCPVWSKKNVVAALWQDVKSTIWNNPNAKNLPYIYTDAYVEAGRVQDAGVRIIECVET